MGNEMEGAVAEEEGAEAPAAEGQEAPAAEGAEKAAPKTYTEEQVSKIVSERVKAWNELGKPDDIKSKLAYAEALQKHFSAMPGADGKIPGSAAQAPETEADKQVRAYIEKLYPGMGKFREFQSQVSQVIGSMAQQRAMEITTRNETTLAGIAEKDGYSKEQMPLISDLVAASIRSTPEDLAKYQQTGSFEVVQKHYAQVSQSFDGLARSRASRYAQTKEKTANLAPKLPGAGLPAPISKQKKVTDEERRAAAFARLTEAPQE